MAAPRRNAMLRPETAERLRDQIRVTQLLKRLEGFALGENDARSKKPIEMSPQQVTAAVKLVGKRLPDLTATQLSSDPENPLAPFAVNVVIGPGSTPKAG